MNKLTQEEYDAFAGLDASYEEMDRRLYEAAPKCHFTKMSYEQGEVGEGDWWECLHCGHVKDFNY